MPRIRALRHILAAIGVVAALAGCGTTPIDLPLPAATANQDRRTVELTADRPFVILAFSGGGSRAAALAAAVTAKLDDIRYTTASGEHRLSADVKIVSSVSGGSVYAAEVALHGAVGADARAFEDRIQSFDGIGYLAGGFLDPVTWLRLQLAGETRIELLQEMLASLLKTDATLSVLNRPGQPLVLLNATDMTGGQVFTFDPDTLGDLCMDFDRVKLVTGVAASAAFPFAFTPVLLKNESYFHCAGTKPPLGDWSNALNQPSGRYENLEAFREARYLDSLRADAHSYREPHYVRLVDGGVADNLGLTSVRQVLETPGSPAYLPGFINRGTLRRLVVIEVNARSDTRNPLDASPEYTSLLDMADAVPGVLVDRAAAGSAEIFQAFVTNLAEERNILLQQGFENARFDIYPIEVNFDQLPDGTDAERAERDAVQSIPTSWTLPAGTTAKLDRAAGELLWRHPCFRDLIRDLQSGAAPEAPPVPSAKCAIPAMPAGQRP